MTCSKVCQIESFYQLYNVTSINSVFIISKRHVNFKLQYICESSTLCQKCDHVFDDNLTYNCPFTKIFGTFITKTIGRRQVFLVSHPTYFVQLL